MVKWHDLAKWVLDRVDSFPKNHRFTFGWRLAEHLIAALLATAVSKWLAPNSEGPPIRTSRVGWVIRPDTKACDVFLNCRVCGPDLLDCSTEQSRASASGR